MSDAPRSGSDLLSRVSVRPSAAWRDARRDGYDGRSLRADLTAGLVVGIIALPLSMALAIASGVPPQYGLYTAIVAGALVAALGGSRTQVSGPTAAFVVILAPIAAQFGLAGLAVATVLAGVIQICMALGGLGRLIQFIPYPVTTGFTAGIAIVIAVLQLRDFFGLTIEAMPETFVERVGAIASAMGTMRPAEVGIGAGTLAVLILWPRFTRRVPAPLVGLTLAAVAAVVLERTIPGLDIATIRDRFGAAGNPHGIPQSPPLPGLPWQFHAPGEAPLAMSFDVVRRLMLASIAIALLGAIESLLSAVVADSVTGDEHDPNTELFAQGVGNVVVPFFGGFAATGALARTSANIRFGARSPLAAITHAAFVLLAMLLLAPLLGLLPMAALAALLMRVAWTMGEARHVAHTVRSSPRSDVIVLLVCLVLTVVFDMVVAVSVGVVLSSLLFMRRMADIADVRLITEHHHALDEPLPAGVVVYEIGGPLFFGAAQKAMAEIRTLRANVRVVILDLRSVPVMDATGLVNLQSAIERLRKQRIDVILAGVQPQPLRVLARGHARADHDAFTVSSSFEHAIDLARLRVDGVPAAS
ncbi:MAG: C4-dicarboxylic acid transporter DauA [Phycisphaerales bacterium]|nr:C4-dicarboxylic acid transporter DauA [Phycisphaerales bacterium]